MSVEQEIINIDNDITDTVVKIAVRSLRTFLFSVSSIVNFLMIKYNPYESPIASKFTMSVYAILERMIFVRFFFNVSSEMIIKLMLIRIKKHSIPTMKKYKIVI